MESHLLVVTHCITACTIHKGAYLASRTTKYLQCLLGHKPVLAFEWALAIARIIDSCLTEERAACHCDVVTVCVPLSQFPPWTPFLVCGDKQAERLVLGGPERSLHSSLVRRGGVGDKQRLFEGLSFVLEGPFEAPGPQREVVKGLLEMGGGRVMMEGEEAVVVVDTRRRSVERTRGRARVVYLWAFDSISNFQLEPFEPYSCTMP